MRTRFLAPLSHRDFLLLWSGQSVSLIGDGVFTVALAWQALQLSPKATGLAAVLFARSLPTVLLLLLGGAITDRLPRRTLLILSDSLRGLAVGAIAVLVFTHSIHLWHLIALGAMFGVANAFFFPAFSAIIPEVLPTESLPAGNALGTTSRVVATNFLGPALGGLVVALSGTGTAFALDAASFFIAIATALLMRARSAPTATSTRIFSSIHEGFRFTRSQPWLMVTLVSASIGNLAFGALGLLIPLVVKQRLHAGAAALGIVTGSIGIGGMIAAMMSGIRRPPRRRVRSMYAMWIAAAVVLSLLGFARSVAEAAALMALAGLLLNYGEVLWITLMQELVPGHMLGRVSSLDWMISLGLTPVAFALAGPLAIAFGPGAVLVAGGALSAVTGIVSVTRKGVLDPDRAGKPAPKPRRGLES